MKHIYTTKCVALLSLFLGINMAIVAQVSQTEYDALIAFYNSTNGNEWTDNTGWDTNGTKDDVTSDWIGLEVDNGHITGMSFLPNNLNGTIPSQIGSLIHLSYLRLNDVGIVGTIPSEIGNLTNLTLLDLTQSNLSGDIPAEIYTLVNLKELSMGGNLTGSIATEISQLQVLEFLALEGDLTGTIPSSIGSLLQLQKLVLGGNNLTGNIPPEIGNLTQLDYLKLSNNSLEGNIPSELGNLSKLEGIDLQYNNLSGSIPSEFSNLSNLMYLHLQYNNFSELPELSNLSSKITEFDVQNNELSFEDLECNIAVLRTYSPQEKVGETQDIQTTIGQDYTLEISVGGENNTYQWYKDNVEISGADNKSLDIIGVKESDKGVYHCIIKNTIATALSLESNEITISVISSTAITENNKSVVRIYPNPVAGNQLYIDTKVPLNEISIYNAAGNEVIHTKDISNGINVSSLSNGVYFLKTEGINQKFIKK